VANVVNVIYQDLALDKEIDTETPLNTQKVTTKVKSYLKSALAAKYNCAPKGRAMQMEFHDQDKCLRDIVNIAKAASTVRVSMERGKWYNAMMGMSGYFK